jgi:hypothetical protein
MMLPISEMAAAITQFLRPLQGASVTPDLIAALVAHVTTQAAFRHPVPFSSGRTLPGTAWDVV